MNEIIYTPTCPHFNFWLGQCLKDENKLGACRKEKCPLEKVKT